MLFEYNSLNKLLNWTNNVPFDSALSAFPLRGIYGQPLFIGPSSSALRRLVTLSYLHTRRHLK